MAKQKILVPYNFTSNDEKSIDFVIQSFGQDKDAEITLFHAYIPVPSIDVNDKTIMTRLAGNLAYLRQKSYELKDEIEKAQNRLIEAGFTSDKVHYVFKPQEREAAQEIIDHAHEGEFTAIVLNRNPSKIKKFFTASISKKVSKALKNLDLYMVH